MPASPASQTQVQTPNMHPLVKDANEVSTIGSTLLIQMWLKEKDLKCVQQIRRKPSVTLRKLGNADRVTDPLIKMYRAQYESLEKMAKEILVKLSGSRLWIRYAMDIKGMPWKAVIPLLAHPPHVTHKPIAAVPVESWICVSFFPVKFRNGKVHEPIIAKFFYSKFRSHVYRYARNALPAPLVALMEESMQKYMARGRSESHARKLAFRDAIRVMLGCTWLVATLEFVEKGLLKPEEVSYPPHLYLEWKQRGLIEPHEIVKSAKGLWVEYTWERLFKRVLKLP